MSDRIISALENTLREAREARGWSQEALGKGAGVSRAEVSAIETGRVIPSTAVALSLARALDRSVEEIFHLPGEGTVAAGIWAWEPGPLRSFWRAEVSGEVLRYPQETTARGVLPQDGPEREGLVRGTDKDPRQTLVLAGCDPAAGILAELLRPSRIRLLPFLRSSARALDLLRARRVHVAGVHLADTVAGNEREVRDLLGAGYRLLPVARWREGVALTPGSGVSSVESTLRAGLRWVGREAGSGARRCLDELFEGRDPPEGYHRVASDHRGVVETIRTGWAQAGVCVELVADEGGLDFLPVRMEAYDLCFAAELEGDPRIRALVEVVSSRRFRGLVDALPGYQAA